MWSTNEKGNSSWGGSSALWSKGLFGIQDNVCKRKEYVILGINCFRNKCSFANSYDLDFCYSTTTVLIKTKKAYKDDGKIITYYNFPQLGVSVPLLLGDLILFDATEPHAIST